MTVTLRPLTASDLDRVMHLEAALFGASAWSRRTYREELAAPGRVYLAAEEAGEVVGWAGIALGVEAQVMTVGVAPGHRRRGIATALLGALLTAAAEAGARDVILEVRASAAGAQALYARAGFVPIGRRRGYYQLEGEDAVVMRNRLRTGPGPVGSEA